MIANWTSNGLRDGGVDGGREERNRNGNWKLEIGKVHIERVDFYDDEFRFAHQDYLL